MKHQGETSIIVPELEELAGGYTPRIKHWNERDIAILRKYYNRVPADDLANHLGRSVTSIQNKAYNLRLTGAKE